MKKILFIHNPKRAHEILALLDTNAVASVSDIRDIIRLLFKKEKYSAVITDTFGRFGVLALLSVLILRAPLVVRLRGDFFREEAERIKARRGLSKCPRYLNLCLGWCCFRASRLVIANSRHIAEAVRHRLKGKPVAVVHNPYMRVPSVAAAATKLPRGRLHLLTVTNMNLYSKIDPTIEAIEGWLDKSFLDEMDIYWIICGSGIHLERLKETVVKGGLEERVLVLGWVDGMDSLYEWSDVLVHLTRIDAFPNATMEAMMHGKPVITNTDSCGTLEQVFDCLNGFVVKEEESFLKALRSYLEKPELQKKHGEAGRVFTEKNFSVPVQKEAMEKVLEGLFSGRKHEYKEREG